MSDYTNPGQQRVLALVILLAGNEFMGATPTELAQALGTSLPNMTRDLANLRTAGLAERMDSGRWRLGPKLIQIALAFSTHVARMSDRLSEIQQRYTRLPN